MIERETMLEMHITPLANAYMSARMTGDADWVDVTCANSTLSGIVVYILYTESKEGV